MSKKAEIDPHGKPAVIVCVRFANDIVEMLDLIADNRSEYVRDATYEKLSKDMKE